MLQTLRENILYIIKRLFIPVQEAFQPAPLFFFHIHARHAPVSAPDIIH
jgi:hypothetical protein